ncbi:MAG: helix-turn-helix domain-containing protein [Pseudomonadota bacterium]|nr:helix-turn-helix domain-containing protein [Pseudomonadota bacterium]
MANTRFSLQDLAHLGGCSPRLVRRYIEQGLLPPAQVRGRGAYYAAVHLDRLRAVGVLKSRDRLRIAVIRQVLDNLSGDEIQQVAAGTALELDALPSIRSSAVNAAVPDSAVQSQPQDRAMGEGDVEIWATVRITADIELRARGLNRKGLGRLRAIAEQLRQVVQTNQPLGPTGAGGLTPGYNERETRSLLTPLDDALL